MADNKKFQIYVALRDIPTPDNEFIRTNDKVSSVQLDELFVNWRKRLLNPAVPSLQLYQELVGEHDVATLGLVNLTKTEEDADSPEE